jgi:hypothetical protein
MSYWQILCFLSFSELYFPYESHTSYFFVLLASPMFPVLLLIAFPLWKDVAHLYRNVILASHMPPLLILIIFPLRQDITHLIGLSYWPVLYFLSFPSLNCISLTKGRRSSLSDCRIAFGNSYASFPSLNCIYLTKGRRTPFLPSRGAFSILTNFLVYDK